jgi:2-iminobutanoate/2-iminopropanoate deaminase
MANRREVIRTDRAAVSRFPISQGVRFGNLIFTAGITARDPRTGQLVEDDIRVQARVVLQSIQAVLEAGGSSMAQVLFIRCYLSHFEQDFDAWNEVYREFFPRDWPARAVYPLDLGPGFRLEVEAVAGVPGA